MQNWKDLPVMICDKFFVSGMDSSTPGDALRIAFGHGIGDDTFYFNAITMNRSNAIELRNMIDTFIKDTGPAVVNRSQRRKDAAVKA
jgi:hypothetical protein